MPNTEIKKEIRLAELRTVGEENTNAMIVEGYAIVFDTPATHCGFTEIIDHHALDGADLSDVPLKYNHEGSTLIMARTRNKSLTLIVDNKGLFIHADLIDTQSNRDIYKSIKSGLLDKMSFAFTIPEGGDVWDYNTNTRQVMKIDKLWDVSVVDVPFYDDTSIYARALNQLEVGKSKDLELLKLKTQILLKL